jgi:N-acetylglucosamine kinase-like BadF-type ATPase
MGLPRLLIADSGSTKTTWCVLTAQDKTIVNTQGISPYFLSAGQIREVLTGELLPKIGNPAAEITHIYYYGTGLGDDKNKALLREVLAGVFPHSEIQVTHDLMGAAHALCGRDKGVASILGTGSNSCVFDGKDIVRNNPGLGFILGDEGSGAFLGKKVVQYYLYHTFDPDLASLFDQKYHTDKAAILDQVYKKPYPNRYLASFSLFLSENRGHFMIENIIEDGLNEFFFHHLCKYPESWETPIHFTGGVAWAFRDVVHQLCESYELTAGQILKAPMEGLIRYYQPMC